jgi:hypothetical protein
MSAPDPPRSARDQLLDQLMAAARREEASERPPRRRRRRRGLALVIALGLGAAAAAGAAELISTGAPVGNRSLSDPRFQPAPAGAPELVAKAPDPRTGTTWGVGVYTSAAGRDCAVAGEVRGLTLGVVRDGRFHAYVRGTSGACASDDKLPLTFDRLTPPGPPRTIVYGRTRRPDRTVVVEVDGKTYSTRPARGGAFLFVFDGRLAPDQAGPRVGPKLAP